MKIFYPPQAISNIFLSTAAGVRTQARIWNTVWKILFSFCVLCLVFSVSSVSAAVVTTTGNGAWSSTTVNAPWPSGTPPLSTDGVIIGTGFTLTVDGNFTTASVGFASVSGTLTVNSPNTLTVTTSITLTGLQSASRACTISGTGTL